MVLFVRKEAKLCIEEIHPVTKMGGATRVLFQFLVPSAKLEIRKQ